MNRTLLKWLLAISLSLNLGIVAAVVAQWMTTAQENGSMSSVPENLPDYLQLTEAQRQRWAGIEPPFLQDIAANWREIRQHREMLVRQIFSPSPDRAAIDAEQKKIALLQDAQQRRVVEQLLAEREVLNEQQRTQLMTLLLSRYTQESTEEERLHGQ